MTTDAREEAERRWPRPRQLDSRDWANDTEETLRYAFAAGAEWQAAQQPEPGHRKPTNGESMQALEG